ncbi:MAG: hypothetical protein IPJ74_23390 [Saprospiraceae bacterium]|nr:hypothetical protein [Saprospiraceae bacterium]
MLIFLLQPVQNWVVQKVSTEVSEKLETKVKVGRLRLNFFDKITLEDFFVEDLQKGDTLLFSENLKVNFVTNPFVLIRRGLTIEEISLENATFNLRKAPKAKETNLEIILHRLFPAKPKADKKGSSFRMDIRRLNLYEVAFLKDDKVKGQRLYTALYEGKVVFRQLDIPGKRIDIRSIMLNQPILQIDEFEGIPAAIETVLQIADTSAIKDTALLKVRIENFQMNDGMFSLHNYARAPVRTTPADELDYQHMDVSDIDIDIQNFSFYRETYLGTIKKIALKERSGFVLNELSAISAKVSSDTTELLGLKIKTPYSEIGDTLVFRHRELADYEIFPDAVNMQGNFHNASVAVRDIMTFAPGLKSNAFFANNKDEVVLIDGEIRGRVNNLRGRDLDIRLSDGSRLNGSFSSRNLAVKMRNS